MYWPLPDLQNYMLELKQRIFDEAGPSYLLTEKLKKRLLCKETDDHIIQFAPPLGVTKDQIRCALETISNVFKT